MDLFRRCMEPVEKVLRVWPTCLCTFLLILCVSYMTNNCFDFANTWQPALDCCLAIYMCCRLATDRCHVLATWYAGSALNAKQLHSKGLAAMSCAGGPCHAVPAVRGNAAECEPSNCADATRTPKCVRLMRRTPRSTRARWTTSCWWAAARASPRCRQCCRTSSTARSSARASTRTRPSRTVPLFRRAPLTSSLAVIESIAVPVS
jgi:hypothetical protein